MVTFILLAALLIVVGVAAVAIPLLRHNPTGLPPAPWAALAATGVIVIGSAITYACVSNWSWSQDQNLADSPQTMVARLARRLEGNPDDLQGWMMLGHSYVVLEQYPLAARAYERASTLAGGQNADALIGEAEALTLEDEDELSGRAGQLLEQALKLEPNSGKALFFGAAAAVHRGDLALGRARFEKLLAMNPPENVRALLQEQIDAIDQRMAGGGAGSPSAASSAAQEETAGPSVRVHVEILPRLMTPDAAGKPLFVFVRDPAEPGPPLAVKRLVSRFPQTVELTAKDSMVPGRVFSEGQKVQVVARISRSGNPLAGSGDPFGEVVYRVGHDGLVNIIINQVTP